MIYFPGPVTRMCDREPIYSDSLRNMVERWAREDMRTVVAEATSYGVAAADYLCRRNQKIQEL